MKLVVLSDIHDNVWKLAAALAKVRDIGPDALICCGDLCAPFIINQLAHPNVGFSGPIHVVFGNNDGDRVGIARNAASIQDPAPGRVQIHGEMAEFIVKDGKLSSRKAFEKEMGEQAYRDHSSGGLRIAVNHYDEIALPIALSGSYDVVFYGHNHFHRCQRSEKTLFANPGAIMGYKGPSMEDIPSTFFVYDSDQRDITGWYEVYVEQANGEKVRYAARDYQGVTVEKLT